MGYAVVSQHVVSSPWVCVCVLCVLYSTQSTHSTLMMFVDRSM